MADEFVRLPPDSTGKRVHTETHSLLYYKNGTILFDSDQIIVGETSGAEALVLKVVGDVVSGILFIKKTDDNINFALNENLRVLGTKHAEVQIADVFVYDQVALIGGGNNSHNIAFVDDKGNFQIRYGEGEQQLDAAGLTRVSSPNLLSEYICSYDALEAEFSTELFGSSPSSTYLSDECAVRLQIGTDTGSYVYRTSDKYHFYQPGYGQLITITAACGDTGKSNVRRRWGYFDGYDGMFFELDGTALSVCVRSSSTGSVVEDRATQANWNVDKVNGAGGLTNLSKIDLDPSKINIYWIDFLWLGAGVTRFGIFDPDGTRITIHKFYHANSITVPYLGRPQLPVRFELENTGTSVSTSELKVVCASVSTDGNVIPARSKMSRKHTGISNLVTITDGYYTPVISFRSALTFNGLKNRMMSLPEFFSFRIKDNDTHVKIVKNATLAGESFSVYPNSALEIDGYATSFIDGEDLAGWMFGPGVYREDSPNNFGYHSEHSTIKGDGTYGDTYSIVAKCLEPGQTSQFQMSVTWIDIG